MKKRSPNQDRSAIRGVCFIWMTCLSIAFIGCGQQGPARCVVSGLVTFNGKPIANGEIRFVPTVSGPVSGAPIIDGNYIVEHKGGVPLGKHTVRITAYTIDANDAALDEGDIAEIGGASEYQYLPPEFNEESRLTVEITAENNPFTKDFEL